ncbi:hypothetical protein K470DRAFT_272319 [Piedraia hortae CBS 480.64]|uniref:cysteine--tRNA ligase n=1 Tax=Piedraia hortae CBS 480.64 TaxID=1314780 RepID=A0A6A7BVQ6_9PEZI|nr:hypothetical protein K470DRAFT_272319 [Piedraia hortae CBS 480.64]
MATQPPWAAPTSKKEPLHPLKIHNSLTRTKNQFIPIDPEGRKVSWYACGPTVYDDAHLGHARNYVSTDIVRRIMQEFFKYDVEFVMNITDVDDKIILAARQQHLLTRWLDQHESVDDEVHEATTQALRAYVAKNLPLIENSEPTNFEERANVAYGHVKEGLGLDKKSPPGDAEAKVKMHLRTAEAAARALNQSESSLESFSRDASGVLLPYIDAKEKHTVSGDDHGIFTALTKRYEQRFFEDMDSLNVRRPDKITRVTEYGPQIVDFVKQIESHGFAYEHQGSVYYDTTAWESSGGAYARLEPANRNNKELQQDGEGSLAAKTTGFKRSGADFALWKASKEGEPSWESHWGKGRPGWHIECSAMASDVLGKQLDIHSGGIDLAFPHHDNELAQSEAYWASTGSESKQWVNYFIHMGHLSIQGSKMSKSLKNFTTVRDALAKGDWTPRSIRIAFLLGSWHDGLELTESYIQAGRSWEERMDTAFLRMREVELRQRPNMNRLSLYDSSLNQALTKAKKDVYDAFCDSFDTPRAMRAMTDLVGEYNVTKDPSDNSTLAVGRWLTEMMIILGLSERQEPARIGWTGIEIPEEAQQYIYPLSHLRDQVRTQAIAGKITVKIPTPDTSKPPNPYAEALITFHRTLTDLHARSAPAKEYLAACDHVRNETLWNLGIYLEDREAPQGALVRPLSQSKRDERAKKEEAAASKAAEKERARLKAEQAEKARKEQAKIDPKTMFKTEEYSAWDDDGIPTKDTKGETLPKSRTKKLKKEFEAQKKAFEAYQKSLG